MRICHSLLAACLVLWTHGAQAQVRIDQVPLHFTAGMDLQVTTLGDAVVLTAKVQATLRNAQETIRALMPALNRRLACGARREGFGFTITDVSLQSPSPFGGNGQVVIAADVSARGCRAGLLHSDVRVSIPFSVLAEPANGRRSIVLRAGAPEISPQGYFLAGLVTIAPSIKDKVNRGAGSALRAKIDSVNAAIRTAILRLMDHRQIRTFNPAIQSVQLATNGSDLTVELRMSGQISGAAVGKWVPKI